MKKLGLLVFAVIAACISVNATTHQITAEDFEFTPPNLSVSVGDTIEWIWDDSGSEHTTTSTSVPAGAASWDHMLNNANPTFFYVVTQPGNYNYHCTIHTNMVGTFTATGSAAVHDMANEGLSITNLSLLNQTLQISYEMQNPAPVDIYIYDVTGKMINHFISSSSVSGLRNETYLLSGIEDGIYLVGLKAGGAVQTKKIFAE